MNPVAIYAEADALIATLKDDFARNVRDVLDSMVQRDGIGPEDYLREAKRYVAHFSPSGLKTPPRPSSDALQSTAHVIGAPTAPQEPTTRRVGRGMNSEVKEAMPDLAYRLYRYAELHTDQDDLFTCGRVTAMKALRASNGGVGTAIWLHVKAGIWKRDQPGQWRWKGGKGPRQTVYRIVRDFDRAHAIRVYREHRAAGKAALRQLDEKRKEARASTVTDTTTTA